MSNALKAIRRRVLLVEDELMIALELQSIIEHEGYEVVGPIRNVSRALAEIKNNPPSMALLDANLEGVSSSPIAEELTRRAIPFGVVTGYPYLREEHDALRQAPHLQKPYTSEEIVQLLRTLSAEA